MSPEQDQDRILAHNYDGIQEYDNPLPPWWVYLFWASIIFSMLYFPYYHFGPGLLTVDAYNKDMVAYYDLQAEQFLAMGPISERTLHDLMSDDAMLAGGAQLFASKCVQCHGNSGEGNIGPNLTDDYWIHGGNLTHIYTTVVEGVPTKGMLAWKNQLRPGEILSVTAFVGSLRGSQPDNAKTAQGDEYLYDAEAVMAQEEAENGGPAADDEPGAETSDPEDAEASAAG